MRHDFCGSWQWSIGVTFQGDLLRLVDRSVSAMRLVRLGSFNLTALIEDFGAFLNVMDLVGVFVQETVRFVTHGLNSRVNRFGKVTFSNPKRSPLSRFWSLGEDPANPLGILERTTSVFAARPKAQAKTSLARPAALL